VAGSSTMERFQKESTPYSPSNARLDHACGSAMVRRAPNGARQRRVHVVSVKRRIKPGDVFPDSVPVGSKRTRPLCLQDLVKARLPLWRGSIGVAPSLAGRPRLPPGIQTIERLERAGDRQLQDSPQVSTMSFDSRSTALVHMPPIGPAIARYSSLTSNYWKPTYSASQ
jgi:hypothetical protein